MLFDAGCWVSSTSGVGFTGVVSGNGILSTLTTSDDYCSLSCNCACALVLILECHVVWVDSTCFGGSIVVIVKHLLTSVVSITFVSCALCFVCFLTFYIFSFSISCFLSHSCFVWELHKSCWRWYLYDGFNETMIPSYLQLLSITVSS
jgi:hypothetical protein